MKFSSCCILSWRALSAMQNAVAGSACVLPGCMSWLGTQLGLWERCPQTKESDCHTGVALLAFALLCFLLFRLSPAQTHDGTCGT